MLALTYLAYVVLSLALTLWVGRTLNRNGKVFLAFNYQDRPDLVDAISNMLLVGFYLINIGFIAYTLRANTQPLDAAQSIELLSTKIGLIAIVLGMMHFGLMIALQRLSGLIKQVAPPQDAHFGSSVTGSSLRVSGDPAPEVTASKA